MDSKTLVITVITAIISAFVKEIASWLLSLGKNASITNKLKEKLKKQITLNKITVFINSVVIIVFIWNLYYLLLEPEPVSRKSIFLIALNLVLIAVSWLRIETVMNNLTLQRKNVSEIENKFNEFLQWSDNQDRKLLEILEKTEFENERNT